MIIYHCADLHLDAPPCVDLPQEPAQRLAQEQERSLWELLGRAQEEGVSALLISGDLFDHAHVRPAVMRSFLRAVREYPQILFVVIAGNRDLGAFAGQRMPENLVLFGHGWESVLIPAPAGEEGARVMVTGAGMDERETALPAVPLALSPRDLNLVLLHGQLSEERGVRGERISRPELVGRGIDYLALGHLHTPESGRLDERGIWCYPGCLEGRSFDECGPRGYERLEIDCRARALRAAFVPLARRRFFLVSVDVTGCEGTAQIADRIGRGICLLAQNPVQGGEAPQEQDLVEVVLTGELSVQTDVNGRALEGKFAPQYFFFRLVDHTTVQLRPGFFPETGVRGELLRVIREASLTPEQEQEVFRCAVRALREG